jgi:apolipoprotein N-acyltransferase
MSYSKPEWGYEGPAREFSRTMGLVLATVIGVTAGAGAVVFLTDQPVAGSSRSTSIITQPVKAALHPGPQAEQRTPASTESYLAEGSVPAGRDEQLSPQTGGNSPLGGQAESSPEDAAILPEHAVPHDRTVKPAASPPPTIPDGQAEKKTTKKPVVVNRYAWRHYRDGNRWGARFGDRSWRNQHDWW